MLIDLYSQFDTFDYLKERYRNDLRFLLYQLQRAFSISDEEKIRSIRTVEWFIHFGPHYQLELEEERQELLDAIMQKDYKKAVQYMVIDPVAFTKSKK